MGPYQGFLGDNLAVVGFIPPVSQAAGTVGTTGFADMSVTGQVVAIVLGGVLGASGTVDFKFQYSSDHSTWVDVDATNCKITQLVANNKVGKITLRAEALAAISTAGTSDMGKARYVRGLLTVGTATSLVSAVLLAGDVKFEPAAANYDNAGVTSNVRYTTSNTTA